MIEATGLSNCVVVLDLEHLYGRLISVVPKPSRIMTHCIIDILWGPKRLIEGKMRRSLVLEEVLFR